MRRRLTLLVALGTLVALPATASGVRGVLNPTRAGGSFTLPTGERVVGIAPESQAPAAVLGEWTQVPRTWPVPAGGGANVYDAARDEVLTFGGCCFQGDLWAFDDGTWRRRDPGVLAPGARASNVAAYDPTRRHVVMFGGSAYGETWIWNGTAWSVHHQVNGPGFRTDAVMAWMPRIGKVVMFGGSGLDPEGIGTHYEDTWAWNGNSWEFVNTPTRPPARYAPGLALDPASGDLILFGGFSDSYESLADTWRFDGTTWRPVQTPVAPPGRSYFQMATNPAIGGIELFSGYDIAHGFAPLRDRWFFVDGAWTKELPGIELGPPPPWRHGGSLVWDEGDQEMVLLQGNCDPTCGGTWSERLVEIEDDDGSITRRLVWNEAPMLWPPDRMSAGTMVEDPLGRGTLMHGGFGDSTGMGEPSDTWAWKDSAWTKLVTENDPPGRQGLALAVHRRSKTIVLFGGTTGYQQVDGRTWVLDGNRWEAKEPAGSPPARYQAAMAEDRNGNVVLFGGLKLLGGPNVERLGDTWVWDGQAWTQHTGPGPSARAYPHMVYDPVRRETVLFGGSEATGTSNQTWVWDGDGWELRTSPVSPTGRLGSAMAWDPAGQQVVLFAGATGANVGFLVTNDVWTWDGTTWLKAEAPRGGPSARWFSLAGPTDDGIIMFGGHGGGTGLPFSDTWLWHEAA